MDLQLKLLNLREIIRKMLNPKSKYYYLKIFLGKIGYHSESKHTCVVVVKKDDLFCTTIHIKNRWNVADHIVFANTIYPLLCIGKSWLECYFYLLGTKILDHPQVEKYPLAFV